MEDASMERRDFLKAAGFAVLAVQCIPAKAFAERALEASSQAPSQGQSQDSAKAANDLIIESGPGAFHHTHYLRIPNATLAAPPASGVQLTTTKALLHQHQIALSQRELLDVRNGGTVQQRASSHVFVIALTKGTTAPAPRS